MLYCNLWPVRLYHVFPHYLINGEILGKKLLNIKCVFLFSLQLFSETLPNFKRIKRHIIITVRRSSCKVTVILSKFNETWICRKILEKSSDTKFDENPSSGWRIVPHRLTDRLADVCDEANSRLLQFCQHVWKELCYWFVVCTYVHNMTANTLNSFYNLLINTHCAPAEIVGSNPTRGMDICLLWVLCVVR